MGIIMVGKDKVGRDVNVDWRIIKEVMSFVIWQNNKLFCMFFMNIFLYVEWSLLWFYDDLKNCRYIFKNIEFEK